MLQALEHSRLKSGANIKFKVSQFHQLELSSRGFTLGRNGAMVQGSSSHGIIKLVVVNLLTTQHCILYLERKNTKKGKKKNPLQEPNRWREMDYHSRRKLEALDRHRLANLRGHLGLIFPGVNGGW